MGEGHVVIVGGGVTGLAVAHRLTALAKNEGSAPLRVTLLEARGELGGNIRTERQGGFTIEAGTDSFAAGKPQALALCRELGLGERLIETRRENRKVYVRSEGRLHALPEGVEPAMSAALTSLLPTALSWRGKLGMARDLMRPRRGSEGDESLGSLLRRRFGAEAAARIAEPLLGPLYADHLDTVSARATFPELIDEEARGGGLIGGAIAVRRAVVARGKKAPSAFTSLRDGMGELIDALAESARRGGAAIRLASSVVAVDRASPGDARFAIRIRDGAGSQETLAADHVVFASYAYAAADAVRVLDPPIASLLAAMPYASLTTVALGFDRADIAHPLDATGIVIPKSEGRRVLSASFASSQWPFRAPSGSALIQAFFGGGDAAAPTTGDELSTVAHAELTALLDIRKAPLFTRVFRSDRAWPVPLVGYVARIGELRDRASAHPGLHFAGAAIDGSDLSDCVRQADQVAARIAGAAS